MVEKLHTSVSKTSWIPLRTQSVLGEGNQAGGKEGAPEMEENREVSKSGNVDRIVER